MQNMVRSDAPGVIVRVLNYMVEDDDDDDDRWGAKAVRKRGLPCPAPVHVCVRICVSVHA